MSARTDSTAAVFAESDDPPSFVLPPLNAAWDSKLGPTVDLRNRHSVSEVRVTAELSRSEFAQRSTEAEVMRRILHMYACKGSIHIYIPN